MPFRRRRHDESEQPRIRKQVYDLVPADLEQFPIWELATDEEGEEGQDEATVRPRPDLDVADPSEGILVVRAELVAVDGTRFDGFLSPHAEPHVGHVQPTIVTEEGQVGFWSGIRVPARGELEGRYRLLGKSAAELFPLCYRALVPCGDARTEGTLDGFLRYAPGGTSQIVAEL
jgi:hypothetical protein